MTTRLKRLAIAGLAGLALAMPVAARAGDGDDHVRARDLFEHGEISALFDILRVVDEKAPGDVVAVDLIQLGDKWVYRFQVVASDGRRSIIDVDARAATIIRGDDD